MFNKFCMKGVTLVDLLNSLDCSSSVAILNTLGCGRSLEIAIIA